MDFFDDADDNNYDDNDHIDNDGDDDDDYLRRISFKKIVNRKYLYDPHLHVGGF